MMRTRRDGGEAPRRRAIAIVEDDAPMLRALGRILQHAGFAVAPFSSAEEFLEKYKHRMHESPPDCLLLDIRLGGLSGFELFEHLRDCGISIPTIFMTANDDAPTRELARKTAVGFLHKPFDDRTLLSAIGEALPGL